MRRKPRRARVELARAGGLLAVLMLVLQPGMAMAGIGGCAVLSGIFVASRARRRRGWIGRVGRPVEIVAAAAFMAIVLAAFSYFGALNARSNSSIGIRSVEWLRGNGAAWLVSDVERLYYSISAPAKGGPALKRLPSLGASASDAAGGPIALAPVIQPGLPGEGTWQATRADLQPSTDSPLLVTTYRPDPSYPRVVAGVARINPRRAQLALYPGIQEPSGGASAPAAGQVPTNLRARLLATFNSGFKFSDMAGGFYAEGRLFVPLRPGLATLVATTSGGIDVVAWHRGARPSSDVVFARQNLPLIVEGGRPNPHLSGGPEWGVTLGNSVLVWRSGIGIDKDGNLLYAAANYRSARGLADILIHAGAVRAMELDINSYWVSFNTYRNFGAAGATKLLPDMSRPATRYLQPDDRDFFAVYAR